MSASPNSWSSDAIVKDFEEDSFLKMMDELNQILGSNKIMNTSCFSLLVMHVGESSPGDKRILKPTIPGYQGHSSPPIAQIMFS